MLPNSWVAAAHRGNKFHETKTAKIKVKISKSKYKKTFLIKVVEETYILCFYIQIYQKVHIYVPKVGFKKPKNLIL